MVKMQLCPILKLHCRLNRGHILPAQMLLHHIVAIYKHSIDAAVETALDEGQKMIDVRHSLSVLMAWLRAEYRHRWAML